MWLLRLTMRLPRPLARAAKRFSTGAASTSMRETFSSSMSAPWLCSALAIADSSTLSTSSAPFFGMKRSCEIALPTGLPRTTSATRRHFCGEMRAYLILAVTCMTLCPPRPCLSPPCPLKVRVGANSPSLCPTMFSVISTGMCCLPLCTAIVRPTISGDDHRAARPGLDRLAVVLGRGRRTFLARCRSTNGPFFSERGILFRPLSESCSCDAARSCWLVRLLVRVFLTLGLPAPRATPGAGCPGRTCPRRRRAGGRPGSSRRRAPSGGCRASASRRPCRTCAGCAHRC
jgi:hypothetical protein